MSLRFGSLFSGIGGMDLGLERAGMECKWQVEIDDYCNKVLAKHWPNVERYRDVKEVHGREACPAILADAEGIGCDPRGAESTGLGGQLRPACGGSSCGSCLSPVDLIAGGFPCQDLSYAGKGAGLEGSRSGLWWEFHRIISELRPRYVIVENVPALLTRGLDVVLGSLAALGYDASWDCIPAAAVGAPHRRDRVFIVADAQNTDDSTSQNQGGRTSLQPGGSCSRNDPHPGRKSLEGREPARPDYRSILRSNAEWWAVEPDVGRVAHGIPARVDRLKGLGNAVVPAVAQLIGELILASDLQLPIERRRENE